MFINDLKEWEAYELLILNEIKSKLWITLEKNIEKKAIDLIGPLLEIEIKYDKGSHKSGNYFLEFMCNGNPSGISKHKDGAKPVFFGIWNNNEFLIFLNSYLLNLFLGWYEQGTYRVIENGGDWWRVKWMLVPCNDLRELALYIIKFNNNDSNIHIETTTI